MSDSQSKTKRQRQKFTSVEVKSDVSCDYCSKDLPKKALSCQRCGMLVHHDCLSKVPRHCRTKYNHSKDQIKKAGPEKDDDGNDLSLETKTLVADLDDVVPDKLTVKKTLLQKIRRNSAYSGIDPSPQPRSSSTASGKGLVGAARMDGRAARQKADLGLMMDEAGDDDEGTKSKGKSEKIDAGDEDWFNPIKYKYFNRAEEYYFGKNRERNVEKAALYYASAVKKENHPRGMVALARFFATGEVSHIPKDFKKMNKLYKMAAKRGDMLGLARCYMGGVGLERNPKKAYKAFLKCATSDQDPRAMYWLGMAYASGIGVDIDKNAALVWYSKAAEFGHPWAERKQSDLMKSVGDDSDSDPE